MSVPAWMQFDEDTNDGEGPSAPVFAPGSPEALAQAAIEEVHAVKSFSFYDDTITIYFDPGPHVYYRFVEDEEGREIRQDIDGVTTVLNVVNKPFLVPWAAKLVIETLKSLMLNPDGSIKNFSTEDLFTWFDEAKNKHKEKLNEAGDIGSLAHDALEESVKWAIEFNGGVVKSNPVVNPPQWLNAPEDNIRKAQNCANVAFDWMIAHNVRWLHTERKIYSREYDYSGTLDGDALIDSCTDRFCKGCRGRVFKNRRAITDWKSSNHLSDTYAYQTAAYQFAHIEEFPDLYIPDRWIMRLGKEEGDFEAWYLPDEYFEADFEAFLAALQLYRSLDEIEGRRRVDKRAFTAFIRAVKKQEREQAEAEEKERKRLAREALKGAKVKWDADRKAFYKELRAQKISPVEAELKTEEKFPKTDRPGAKGEVDGDGDGEQVQSDVQTQVQTAPSGDIAANNRAVTTTAPSTTSTSTSKPRYVAPVSRMMPKHDTIDTAEPGAWTFTV